MRRGSKGNASRSWHVSLAGSARKTPKKTEPHQVRLMHTAQITTNTVPDKRNRQAMPTGYIAGKKSC